MLRGLIKVMGEPNSSITMMKDLLDEIANTVTGNARSEFVISLPMIVKGAPRISYLPKDRHSYVIPFTWL